MDIDAAGGVATAGLIGAAIEKPTGEAGEATHGVCSDCGAATEGKFCSNCGQPTHVHRSLLHLGEEMLHGVLHFDARIWRTLPLLAFNPGRLTREWVQGKRTRYVSPLAIFLFTVFLMFFAFSFMGGLEPRITENTAPERAAATSALAQARAELEATRAAAAADPTSEALAKSVRGQEMAVTTIARITGAAAPASGEKRPDGLEAGSWQAQVHDAVASGDLKVSTGNEHLNKKITKKLLNPDLAIYKLQQTTYKFSFLLIPLSIPFVALLFLWRRGFTLYDHGVFVLYSLTAISILFLLAVVLGPLWSGFAIMASLAFMIGVPVHMFAQLKGAYGLSWFSAGWRTVMLLMFSIFALSLFFVSIIMLGLTG